MTIINSISNHLSVNELNEMIQTCVPLIIIDIRSVELFENGHIYGALHLPWRMIDSLNVMGLDINKSCIVYGDGVDSTDEYSAVSALSKLGFDPFVLTGGLTEWLETGFSTVKPVPPGKYCCRRGCGCDYFP